MKRRFALRSATAAIMLTAAAGAAQAQSEFKVGFVLSQVGPLAELAKTYLDGAEVGVAMVNDTGGIGGLKVRLIACDAQGQEPQAVICAKKLINDDKVNLMIGATGTPQTMAIIPTAESAGVPLFGMGAGRVIWEPVKKWVFKSFPSNDDQIPAELNYAKKKGWNRVALLTDNTSFGKDTVEMTHEVVKKNGMDLVAEESLLALRHRRERPGHPRTCGQSGRRAQSRRHDSTRHSGGEEGDPARHENSARAGHELRCRQLSGDGAAGNRPVLLRRIKDDGRFAAERSALSATSPRFARNTRRCVAHRRSRTGNTITVPDILLMVQKATQGMGAKVLDPEALRTAIEQAHDIPELQGIWNLSPTNHGNSFAAGTVVLTNVKGEWKLAE